MIKPVIPGVFGLIISILFSINTLHASPDWSKEFSFPKSTIKGFTKDNRANIYGYSAEKKNKFIKAGSKHVLIYPVEITKLLLPYNAMLKYFDEKPSSPIRKYIYKIAQKITNVHEVKDFFSLIGTVPYPQHETELGPNLVYDIPDHLKKYPMGTTIIQNENGPGLTFSCAACHSANLFGVKVIGLTNRFPKSNDFFVFGKKASTLTNSAQFKILFGASDAETRMMKESILATKSIGAKKPSALGLDTSLRQTALSLARRAPDEYASIKRQYQLFPRYNALEKNAADSKPSVWWNLKYKTRWLSDGSVVSGNPVHTNLLWNEIGRGANLKEMSAWLKNNHLKVQELTSYVFNTTSPKYNDFFPGDIDTNKAKLGEKLYLKSCAKCHGIYKKGWSSKSILRYEDQIKTTEVFYHQKTPVINVGTDPARYRGMNAFYQDLNRLKISKEMGTLVEPQKGYVPPPLVGIWARWPYFHNNAAPNLCEVLTPEKQRISFYYSGPAIDKSTDYDKECSGYPYPKFAPDNWKKDSKHLFDNSKIGLKNTGHSKMLLNEDGSNKFNREQKLALIEFLKTL